MKDDPPSPAERRFLALLQDPAAFAAWSEQVRLQWEREHGVEWLHSENGVQVWRPRLPPLDPEHTAQFRFNPKRAAHYAAKRAAAAAAAASPQASSDDPR